MSVPCPRCQHPIAPGATFCTNCGASLLLEAHPGGAEPTCAIHPTVRSLAICDRCGAFACARCLRAGPHGETLCESCHARDSSLPMPWDQREELGTLKAFWMTMVEVLFRPGNFSQVRPEGSPGSSLLFALLCSLPPSLMMGLLYLGVFGMADVMAKTMTAQGAQTPPEHLFQWMAVGFFAACAILGPLLSVATTVVGAGIDHFVLRMVGGVTRGYAVTLRAHALSQAPWVLGAVPFFGSQVAPFWALVARVYAYRGLHRTTWGVALAGALLAPLLTCFLCGGSYLLLMMSAFGKQPGQ